MQKLCDAKVFLNKNNLVFDLLYLARHTCQSLSEKKNNTGCADFVFKQDAVFKRDA